MITIIATKKQGLSIYAVIVRGTLAGTFLSHQAATVYKMRLAAAMAA